MNDTKHTIIQTAMRLFRKQGYASVGLSHILQESGVPKGSLYHHFPQGKEQLAEAAVLQAGEMIAQMLMEQAQRTRTPQGFIRGYCEQMADWMAQSDYRSGCPIATTVLETVPQSSRIRAAAVTAIDQWKLIIRDVLEAAGIRQAKRHAEALVGAVEGALLLARVYRSREPLLNVAATFSRQLEMASTN